jgi:hypothetical protein
MRCVRDAMGGSAIRSLCACFFVRVVQCVAPCSKRHAVQCSAAMANGPLFPLAVGFTRSMRLADASPAAPTRVRCFSMHHCLLAGTHSLTRQLSIGGVHHSAQPSSCRQPPLRLHPTATADSSDPAAARPSLVRPAAAMNVAGVALMILALVIATIAFAFVLMRYKQRERSRERLRVIRSSRLCSAS